MADLSLGEYLAQAQRGMGGGYFGRVSGPLPGYAFGPDFFKKQTYLQITDTFIATYGKKVWDALNNRTVTFNAIKKVDWGPTVGWRLRTDRGTGRSRPVTETGALPTIDVSNYVGVFSYPKQIVTVFGVSLKAQAVSALEGGIGNQFAVEQEASSRDHVKEINKELMAGGAYLCSGGGADTAIIGGAAAAWALADHIKIGDTIAKSGVDTARTVTGVATGTGTITATSISGADGTSIYVKSRNGLTSIDDIVSDDLFEAGNVVSPIDVYNLTTRTAGAHAAGASVSHNNGVGRDLTLTLVDAAIKAVRQNGGEPKLIVTGLDQYDKLNQLLQAQQRFVDVTDYIVGVGDERTYPGTRAGFQLATYRGVPILPDPDAPAALNTADTVLGTNLYVLDTDYLELAVQYPTQYVENRDYFARMGVCGEIKPCYMLENPGHLSVLSISKNLNSGDNQQGRFYKESPQRLYAGCSERNEDIVRTGQRCSEIGRNDQSTLVCLNCGKILVRNQKKYCSKFCQGRYSCNFPEEVKAWNVGKTKEEYPQLSNSGVKKGNIPWNKNIKGLQIAWNLNLTKETDVRVAKYGNSHKGHPCYEGSGRGKSDYREDLGHFVRSSWEANVCRILKYLGIAYEYEKRRFDLGEMTYCIDLSLNYNTPKEILWEVKGYKDAHWNKKLELFKKVYPEWKLVVIDKKVYLKMKKIYSSRIANWEK